MSIKDFVLIKIYFQLDKILKEFFLKKSLHVLQNNVKILILF